MIKVVIDTNVLVSSLISPNGAPAKILDLLLNGMLIPCFDSRIITEYEKVLLRPKFKFNHNDVKTLINYIKTIGISTIPSLSFETFTDEEDRKFYEVAIKCSAKLITGNLKHFPRKDYILLPADFLKEMSN